MDAVLLPALEKRRQQFLYRQRKIIDGPQQPRLNISGRTFLSFCSNDYLGLSNHPAVREQLKKGVDKYGAGSGAAHLVSGHTRAHHQLEEDLAEFTGRSRALLFSTPVTHIPASSIKKQTFTRHPRTNFLSTSPFILFTWSGS